MQFSHILPLNSVFQLGSKSTHQGKGKEGQDLARQEKDHVTSLENVGGRSGGKGKEEEKRRTGQRKESLYLSERRFAAQFPVGKGRKEEDTLSLSSFLPSAALDRKESPSRRRRSAHREPGGRKEGGSRTPGGWLLPVSSSLPPSLLAWSSSTSVCGGGRGAAQNAAYRFQEPGEGAARDGGGSDGLLGRVRRRRRRRMGVAGAGARRGSWERPLPPSDWVGEPPTCFIAISERGEKGRRREPPRRRRRPRDRHGSARGQIVRPGSKEGSGVARPVAALPPAGAGAGGATFTSVPPPLLLSHPPPDCHWTPTRAVVALSLSSCCSSLLLLLRFLLLFYSPPPPGRHPVGPWTFCTRHRPLPPPDV